MQLWKCRPGFFWSLVATVILSLTPGYWNRQAEQAQPPATTLENQPVAPQPRVEVVEGTIQKNATLVATLVDFDVPVTLANQLADLIQPVFDVRKLRWGNLFRLEKEVNGTLRTFEYKIDDERILRVEKNNDTYAAKVETLEFESRQAVVTADIQSSLWDALSGYPKGEVLVNQLADQIFAWDVDFSNDIQRGDRIRLVVDEQYYNGEFVKYGKVLAAELVNSGKPYRAFLFKDEYYDEEGNAVKRGLLRSPLQFTRVSSGFTRRRMHPILGTVRAHLAVDYAAPTGTPVQAVASGTVTFAGTNGGYGRMVEIRHANGLRTGYAHLSRISSGIRTGRAVKQGEVIGAVGQTGLATGPHLHYMMTRNGTPINPLTLTSEPPTPMDPGLKPEYFAFISGWNDRFREAEIQTASQTAGPQLVTE